MHGPGRPSVAAAAVALIMAVAACGGSVAPPPPTPPGATPAETSTPRPAADTPPALPGSPPAGRAGPATPAPAARTPPAPPAQPGSPPPGATPPQGPGPVSVSVTFTGATYRTASGAPSGSFRTGQPAELMLSGVGFNQTGGALLFNHPAGIATDGRRLLLSDRNNNRVLIWNALPDGNTPPDLVLGQAGFDTNAPGSGMHQLNWPSEVDTDGTRVVVADTVNERILLWTAFPTRNASPADLVLHMSVDILPASLRNQPAPSLRPHWPWGVWTDGTRLAVAATGSGIVLIWSTFPTRDDQPADLYIRAQGRMGTPRHITSDGTRLLVGDHNPRAADGSPLDRHGTWVWDSWPQRDDEPFAYFLQNRGPGGQGSWLRGAFTADGRLALLGDALQIWNSFPPTATTPADVLIGQNDFRFGAGDGEDIAIAGDRVYINLYNGNRVVAYAGLPSAAHPRPDFAIGAPGVGTNTLDTHYFITNPAPATDGTSLFVASDFDRKLYVWRHLPDEDGAPPDLVYSFANFGPWDIALHGGRLVLVGQQTVMIWDTPPLDGRQPDRVISGGIGGVAFRKLQGVALDDRRLYIADGAANAVYVWDGIPDTATPPALTLPVAQPVRLSSDGAYLAVTATFDHSALLYPLGTLGSAGPIRVGGPGRLNLPGGVTLAHGTLFLADTPSSRVLVWHRVDDAIAQARRGEFRPDAVLGEANLTDRTPEIGRDKLFWPGLVAFDGGFAWVGEFKFSGRLMRFRASP